MPQLKTLLALSLKDVLSTCCVSGKSFVESEGKLRANVMFLQLSHYKIADCRAKQIATTPDVSRLIRKRRCCGT